MANKTKTSTKQHSKYHSKKCEYDGHKFDSQRERDRYIVLKEALDNGVITDLQIHPKYTLLPALYRDEIVHLKTKDKIVQRLDQRAIHYTGDFSYRKDGKFVLEDVKISKYMLPKEFILKEYMMYYFHKIRIRCVFKASEPV